MICIQINFSEHLKIIRLQEVSKNKEQQLLTCVQGSIFGAEKLLVLQFAPLCFQQIKTVCKTKPPIVTAERRPHGIGLDRSLESIFPMWDSNFVRLGRQDEQFDPRLFRPSIFEFAPQSRSVFSSKRRTRFQ